MKKRRQHYVWKHYLEAWAPNGRLWCQRDGKRFSTTPDNVAHQRDFYRLEEIRKQDLEFVVALTQRMPEHARDAVRGWIPLFTVLFDLKHRYESTNVRNPELERQLDIAINNMEEELHAGVEDAAVPLLAELRAGSVSFLHDGESSFRFCWFLAMQYFRTPKRINALASALSGLTDFDVKSTGGLLRAIFSTTVGGWFFVARPTLRVEFLDAPQSGSFVTGDQPLINLRAAHLDERTPPTEFELYYPLTPTLAATFFFDHTHACVERCVISDLELRTYNERMLSSSFEQVYAESEASLQTLLSDRRT